MKHGVDKGVIGVTVLGSTGSIGEHTLDVLARNSDRFDIIALSAARSADVLLEQCRRFRPRFAVMNDVQAGEQLATQLAAQDLPTELLIGEAGLEQVVALPDVECVVAGIVGAAGLTSTLHAARHGKRILLANKEALVMAGELLLSTVREHGAVLLPVDSEHNAIFQCLPGDFGRGLEQVGVTEIVLTASGGPFRDRAPGELAGVTPEQACAHPNWQMGRKISVDSATMMNKGLEVIEARWLFAARAEQLSVVMHRESIVHSLVRFKDGSMLAQMGNPDMRTPIAHALAWPQRIDAGVSPLDLAALGGLSFEPVDMARFPCLRIAFEALAHGGTAAAVVNAANEIAVQAFLDRKLRFDRIHEIIERTLADSKIETGATLDMVFDADREARQHAGEHVARYAEVDAA
jgi:1-deoxy-D-xylulose-5-phosphate reductoisomerase